jgi:hypothetical protein
MEAKANHTCPLCGGPNECAPARSGSLDTPCWCRTITISDDALARVPAARRNESCLCRRCAEATPSQLPALVSELGAFLARARHLLDGEIRGYPTPIPRCDAQFNFLYEQRDRLARQLKELADLGDAATASSRRRALDGFLRSPPFSDLAAERALRARIEDGLARDDP